MRTKGKLIVVCVVVAASVMVFSQKAPTTVSSLAAAPAVLVGLYMLSRAMYKGSGDDGTTGSDLVGFDFDDNGIRDDIDKYIGWIRDDIDKYIGSLKLEPKKMAVAQQYARAVQAVMVLVQAKELGDSAKVWGTAQQVRRASHCLFDKMDIRNPEGWEVKKSIERMTHNSDARAMALMRFDAAIPGSVWTMPQTDTCNW